MQKILIIYTGGTIGMQYNNGYLHVGSATINEHINSLMELENVQLDLIQYEHLIDSSDITYTYWAKIIADIIDNYDKYHGFVIIHGTDTMVYTANILAFSMRGLSKPIILTGAQLPLVHKRSDGWGNLVDSIYSAMQPNLNEVAIAFNHKLLRGCRTQKISANNFTGFRSVDGELLAEFGININWYQHRWIHGSKFSFSPIIPKHSKILLLNLCPSYTTDFITDTLKNIDKTQVDAVILGVYGTGTIPMSNHHFTHAIKMAIEKGVIIVATTQVVENRITNTNYVNSKLSELGIIHGCDMTIETTFAKLTILLSTKMGKDSIKGAMSMNLIGELTENPK